MARYRNDVDDERDYNPREERLRREALGSYEEPYSRRPRFDNERRFDNEGRPEYGRGRFGERADYEYDEPRYSWTYKHLGVVDVVPETLIALAARGSHGAFFEGVLRPTSWACRVMAEYLTAVHAALGESAKPAVHIVETRTAVAT